VFSGVSGAERVCIKWLYQEERQKVVVVVVMFVSGSGVEQVKGNHQGYTQLELIRDKQTGSFGLAGCNKSESVDERSRMERFKQGQREY
jgi:hypothetical protein